LEDRLALVPHYQLGMFGDTPDAIRRKFLNDVIVHDELLALGAEEKHLDKDVAIAGQIARSRSDLTLRALRQKLGVAAAISMDDVRKYYEENRERYDSPERVNVWRILCKTREEAAAVLDSAKKDGTVGSFTSLAREHSIDKGTSMRAGNLGFLSPDGSSNEAGVKVDPAIVAAAKQVKDGQFVPTPIAEGANFAVIWRRGTVGASHRTVEMEAEGIRTIIAKQRFEEAQKKMMDDLRAAHVSDVNEGLLASIEIRQATGAVMPRKRPGQVPPLNVKVK
jgi:peptidyl-prolyl cis-trans isomerase C